MNNILPQPAATPEFSACGAASSGKERFPERTGGDQPRQLDALTGVRGLAALWVVIYHFHNPADAMLIPAARPLVWIFERGYYAVSLFFMLSGFILVYSYHSRFQGFSWSEYRRFLWLRVARIYPAYIVALAVLVCLLGAASVAGTSVNYGRYSLRTLGLESLMIHKWIVSDDMGWNYPGWSLSVEWFDYVLIFPFAMWLLRYVKNIPVQIGCIAGIWLITPLVYTMRWPVWGGACLFLIGAVLWKVRQSCLSSVRGQPSQLDLWAAGLILTILWFYPSLGDRLGSLALMGLFAVLLLGLSRADGLVSRLMALPAVVYLGEVSYSLYLTHTIVLKFCHIAIHEDRFMRSALVTRLGIVALYVALIALAALCLYYFVERPARTWLRRLGERPSVLQAQPVAIPTESGSSPPAP